MENLSQPPAPNEKNESGELLRFWGPILILSLTVVLLTPRQHTGKMAIIALAGAALFGWLIMNLRLLSVERGSSVAKLLAGLAIAMPIISMGGCIRYSFLNETSSYKFILFNGAEQPVNIVFDGHTLHLKSRQAIERELFSDRLTLTDPMTSEKTEMTFPKGLNIIAYGKHYGLTIKELAYKRLSFSDRNNSEVLPDSRIVRDGIFSMSGDFFIYMPGEKVPNTISRPKNSTTRYLSLSVAPQ